MLRDSFSARICLLSLALLVTACATEEPMPQAIRSNDRWAVYYDEELPAAAFHDYDLVVFDRRHHPDIAPLKGKTIVLAYVSAGEVHDGTAEQKRMAKENLLGAQNRWGSYPVDITSPIWHGLIFAQVSDALQRGFDGVMLDTLDTPLHLAGQESGRAARKTEKAAARLIKDLRRAYPGMKIMVNRGFTILPKVAKTIDYALGESMLAQTDVSTGQFILFPPEDYASAASKLLEAREISPRLKLYTLDYWNQDDVHGLRKLYALQRSRGFVPYVTTPDLRRHTPEPVPSRMHARQPGDVGEQDA